MYAGKNGSFSLYEDNGITYAYEEGNYHKTYFKYQDDNEILFINPSENNFPEMFIDRIFTIKYITPENPQGIITEVIYNGKPLQIHLSRNYLL